MNTTMNFHNQFDRCNPLMLWYLNLFPEDAAKTLQSEAAARHVESHFPAGSPQPTDRASLREREQREFELLRAQYGMDNQGNFREQSVTNMQRAVYAGEMSVADYYERTLDLRAAESCGIDDGRSITRGLVINFLDNFLLFIFNLYF